MPLGVAGVPDVPVRPAMDTRLRQCGHDLGAFLSDLFDLGAIEPCSSASVRERAGLFFVSKKDSQLRLIWDTRRSNAHFETPAFTALPSGESLAALEVGPGERLHAVSADVECCFYQFGIPPWLRPYFGLPEISLRFLPPRLRQAVRAHAEAGAVSFRARVLPMGWAWSVFFVQAAHRHVLRGVLADSRWLTDKVPMHQITAEKPAKLLYIDNFCALALSEEDSRRFTRQMVDCLSAAGIFADFDATDDDHYALLGFRLAHASGHWELTDKKFWRLVGALDHVLAPNSLMTGREAEVLIGHAVAALMLRRDMLSLFHSLYVFAADVKLRRVPVWPSVRRELRWLRALLPLVRAQPGLEWSPTVYAYDASPAGFGIVEREWPAEDVARTGRLSERALQGSARIRRRGAATRHPGGQRGAQALGRGLQAAG